MPRLAVDKAKGNIFEMINFSIYNEDSQSIKFKDLSAICDSIVWTTEHANIILLMPDDSMHYPAYVIYAEPKKG